MPEVAPCYLETMTGDAFGFTGVRPLPSTVNAIVFLQSFLEVFVVCLLSRPEVDPCAGEGRWHADGDPYTFNAPITSRASQ